MSEESKIVTACLQLLEVEFNLGNVKWFGRLQSGDAMVKKSYKSVKTGKLTEYMSRMRGCKKGTADLFYINDCDVQCWVEVKTSKGKLNPDQNKFKKIIKEIVEGHVFLVVRSAFELTQHIHHKGGLDA